MTTEAKLPATSAPPTALRLWTRARGPVLAFALLLVAAITLAALRSDTRHGAHKAQLGNSRQDEHGHPERGVAWIADEPTHGAAGEREAYREHRHEGWQ